MSGVRLLVGTRKGAFILTADGQRREWQVDGPHFFFANKRQNSFGGHGRPPPSYRRTPVPGRRLPGESCLRVGQAIRLL